MINILPEPELLVIFFWMSLKKPRVGIFFIFPPVLILIHGFFSRQPLMQLEKVSTSCLMFTSWGMMNPVQCGGYFISVQQVSTSLKDLTFQLERTWWYFCNLFDIGSIASIRYLTFWHGFCLMCLLRRIWVCLTTNCERHPASGNNCSLRKKSLQGSQQLFCEKYFMNDFLGLFDTKACKVLGWVDICKQQKLRSKHCRTGISTWKVQNYCNKFTVL